MFGLLNIVLLWAATLIGPIGTALSDIVSTLGLIAAMFYLLTAGTAVWFYRRTLTISVSAFMAFVIIYTLATGGLNGVEIGAGFGLAALGLVLSFVAQRAGRAPFYSGRPEVHEPGTAAPGAAADQRLDVGRIDARADCAGLLGPGQQPGQRAHRVDAVAAGRRVQVVAGRAAAHGRARLGRAGLGPRGRGLATGRVPAAGPADQQRGRGEPADRPDR